MVSSFLLRSAATPFDRAVSLACHTELKAALRLATVEEEKKVDSTC